MASQEKDTTPNRRKRPPATTPEGREAQLVSLAMDVVEEKMRTGKASSQEITHFLKLGSPREKLEREKLAHENEFLKAKTEAMASLGRVEELMTNALDAFRDYSPTKREPDEEDFRHD